MGQNERYKHSIDEPIAPVSSPTTRIEDTPEEVHKSEPRKDLLNSKIFLEYFHNFTHPEWNWVDWTREGLLLALSTDKPVYKPGDTLEARTYFFNYTDKAPVSCKHFSLNYEIIDSNEKVIESKSANFGKTCEDIGELYKYEIPKDMKGGVYYIKAFDYSAPPTIVKFRVRSYHSKALVTLDYSQESFNPGDTVEGKLTLRQSDDEPIPDGSYFDITTASGEKKSNIRINSNGFGLFSFKVPADWKDTSIFISYTLHIGQSQSTKTDILTVVQKDTVLIEFTAQSGPLVSGTCQKIYFEAFSDDSRAEHIDITNSNIYKNPGESSEELVLSAISTKFHGRGHFELCTEENTNYGLRYGGVDHFLKAKEYNKAFKFDNDEAKSHVSMKLMNPVLENNESFDIEIQNGDSPKKIDLLLAIYQKNIMLYTQEVTINKKEIKLTIPSSKISLPNGGVISVSLYETKELKKKKDSERIVFSDQEFPYLTVADTIGFILPSKTLGIKLKTDKESYSGGEEVKYEVSVFDKKTGKEVKEDVYVDLSVTDLSAFLEVESKRQPSSLVSTVYLEKEVNITKEYEFLNANEYLNYLYETSQDSNVDGKEAKEKIELLLGTQKWRLFKFDPVVKGKNQYDLSYDMQNLYTSFSSPPILMDKMEAMPRVAMNNIGDIRFKGAQPQILKEDEKYEETEEAEDDEFNDEELEEETISSEEELIAERVDFKQTQLFSQFIIAKNGHYKGSFKLGDLITKFRFEINSVTKAGVYGMHHSYFNSNKDFYIESNLPFFFTSLDKIDVPVIIHNNKNTDLKIKLALSTSLKNKELEFSFSESKVTVPKHSNKEVIIKFKGKIQTTEDFKIKIEAKCDQGCSDSFSSTSKIIGRGFPVVKSQSGFIGTNGDTFKKEAELEFNLPSTFEGGSLELKAKVYIRQMSYIVEALEKLIRDPHGCFEQTSATTYPMVMALILMQNLPEKDDKVTQMIIEGKQKLSAGYKKLTSFETDTGGYEWFGKSPGHESLTAYGLMQFNEMKEVLSEVDEGMIDRTREWILNKRDGKGSFSLADNGLDSFGNPPHDLSDAYILWVLTSIGESVNLEKEINSIIEKANSKGDSYLNALVANILYNVGRTKEAKEFSRMLKARQDKNSGEVERKETSITRSSGNSLNIETTALSTLAWMKDTSGQFADCVELGVNYIVQNVKDGKYGSTQGTILSLKVLIQFLKDSKLEGNGIFEVVLDGHSIQNVTFEKNEKASSIEFNDALTKYLGANSNSYTKHSTHNLKIVLNNFKGDENKFKLSYSIQATFKDLTPKSNPNSDLKFTLTSSNNAEEGNIGDIDTYKARIQNKDQENGKGMTLAIIRIPSCQEIDYNSLERLQNQNKVSYFEVFNGNTDVVLYWKSLKAGEVKEVSLSMTQTYNTDMCIFRPSKAYLYYDEDGSEV